MVQGAITFTFFLYFGYFPIFHHDDYDYVEEERFSFLRREGVRTTRRTMLQNLKLDVN